MGHYGPMGGTRERKKFALPPSTFVKVYFLSLNSKTGQNDSLNFKNRSSYLPSPVISNFEVGFIFIFFIYFS
jgi:hypothetical protein